MQWVPGVLPQGIKWPGLEVERSLPPSAKLNKECSSTSTAPTMLSWCGQGQLYFFFLIFPTNYSLTMCKVKHVTWKPSLESTDLDRLLSITPWNTAVQYCQLLHLCSYHAYWIINVCYIPTYVQISSVKLILKLLQHVSVLIHHLQTVYSFVSWSYELLKW